MTLLDTLDSVLMLGAYGWAFVQPARKLYYNMAVTLLSVIVAVLVGATEALGLIGEEFGLRGRVWEAVAALNNNFGLLGYCVIALFGFGWLAAALLYRVRHGRVETV